MAHLLLSIYDDGQGGVIVDCSRDRNTNANTKTLATETVRLLETQIAEIVVKAQAGLPKTIH